jgi:hypothetical protein
LPNTAAKITGYCLSRGSAQCDVEAPLDEPEPVVPLVPELDGAVPVPVAPAPLPLVPLVPPGVALVEPVVAAPVPPLLLVLFVAPAPMPAALRVVVMSLDVLVVDWQPAASAAARQRPNKAAGRSGDGMLMCDDS